MTTRSIRRATDPRPVRHTIAALALLFACTDPLVRKTTPPEQAPQIVTPPPVAAEPPPPPALPPLLDVAAPLLGQHDGASDAAIIVAIETYNFDLRPVPGALENAEAWRTYLRDVRGVRPERIRLLKDRNATNNAILRSIAEMAPKVGKAGRLWFVFIGHGAPSDGDQSGMLVGVDAQAEVELLKDRSIPQDVLIKQLSATRGTPIAILDACFSGRDSSGQWLLDGIQPVFVPPDEQTRRRRKSVRTAPRLLILSASSREEYAGQLADHKRPAFSYLVLGALRGWADLDHDGVVTADETITYTHNVLAAVLNQSRTQTPTRIGDGALVLAKAAEPEPQLITLLTAPTTTPTTVLSPEICPQQTHFDPSWPPLALPVLDATQPLRAEQSSIQSDLAYAAATDAQDKGQASPAAARRAWCDLAKSARNNPYQSVAINMCAQWTDYQDGLAWLDGDLRCIHLLQQALSRVPDRLVHHLHGFVTRYANLTWHKQVSELKAKVPYLNTQEVLVLAAGPKRTYVDLHTVNVAAYHACVAAGACSPRIEGASQHCSAAGNGAPEAWDQSNPQSIRCISPAQASRYCAWVGKRLPTGDILSAFIAAHPPTELPETRFLQQFVAEDSGSFSLVIAGGGEMILQPDEAWDYVRFRCSRTTTTVRVARPG